MNNQLIYRYYTNPEGVWTKELVEDKESFFSIPPNTPIGDVE